MDGWQIQQAELDTSLGQPIQVDRDRARIVMFAVDSYWLRGAPRN
jgi:hypothetical protein